MANRHYDEILDEAEERLRVVWMLQHRLIILAFINVAFNEVRA